MNTVPIDFKTILNTYAEQFPSVLDDFKQSFVNYNKYMELTSLTTTANSTAITSNEYSNIYNSNKANVDKLFSNLFVTTNELENDINTLIGEISNLEDKVDIEKNTNDDLKKQLLQLESSDNGADILISDSKKMYIQQYVSNITLFVGILLLGGGLFVIFKKSSQSNSLK